MTETEPTCGTANSEDLEREAAEERARRKKRPAKKKVATRWKEPNLVDKRCRNSDWRTPEKILGPVRKLFGGVIPLDPATSADNPTRAGRFFTPAENGLVLPWDAPWFLNPPYGAEFQPWVRHMSVQAAKTPGVALLPAGSRFSTGYFQDFVLTDALSSICVLRGRVSFLDAKTGRPVKRNPYDSIVYGYGVDQHAFFDLFRPLGKTYSLRTRPLFALGSVGVEADRKKGRR